MTPPEERRALREAQASFKGWSVGVDGLPMVCPSCLANDWLDGELISRMREHENAPDGTVFFHYRCTSCGCMVPSDFLLHNLCRCIPETVASWN